MSSSIHLKIPTLSNKSDPINFITFMSVNAILLMCPEELGTTCTL
jgi:hypothetical protein